MPYKKKSAKNPWMGRVQIGGKVITRAFSTKVEALAWEADTRRAGPAPEPVETGPVTALDWANEYLDHVQASQARKTYDEKLRAFRELERTLGPDVATDRITPRLALRHLGRINREHSGCRANKDRKNLAAAWRWGQRFLGLGVVNPFREVDRFPEIRNPRHVPSLDDFWAAHDLAEPEDQVMLLTFLHTAARRNEIFRLRWTDVDLEGGRIRLWTSKRAGGHRESNLLPLTSELALALREHKRRRFGSGGVQSTYVFSGPDGQPYSTRRRWLRGLCERAKVAQRFTLHGIRHLSASVLAESGYSLTTVQGVLRHKSANTTARYLHMLTGLREDLGRAFERPRSGKTKAPDVTASRAEVLGRDSRDSGGVETKPLPRAATKL